MVDFFRTFQHLLPDSLPWRLVAEKQHRQFFEGLASMPNDAAEFTSNVYLDQFADTTRELDMWEDQFGYDASDQDEATRRQILAATFAALGGQSPHYLQNLLQAYGFDVYAHEWWDEVFGVDPDSTSFSVASEDAISQGLAVKPDGTMFWITGFGGDVHEYECATAWDINTAFYTGNSFDHSTEAPLAVDVVFSADGFTMFVTGGFSTSIFQYDLSTAYDVTSASYSGNSFNFSSESTGPRACIFNDDGTKLFMCEVTGSRIYQYSVSPAYDASGITYDSVFLQVGTSPDGMAFNSDGTILYIGLQGGDLEVYTLGTAYAISTATLDVSYGTGVGFNGLALRTSDDLRMFALGANEVHQLTFGSAVTTKDPRDHTNQALIGTVQCGEPLAQCGEPDALCNSFLANEVDYLVNKDLTNRAPPPVPSDPNTWPHFIYWGGETFPERAEIGESRRAEFERLLLKYNPAQKWLVTLVDYLEDSMAELPTVDVDTVFLAHLNGGLTDIGPNALDLTAPGGEVYAPGHVPGTLCYHTIGNNELVRGAHDSELLLQAEITVGIGLFAVNLPGSTTDIVSFGHTGGVSASNVQFALTLGPQGQLGYRSQSGAGVTDAVASTNRVRTGEFYWIELRRNAAADEIDIQANGAEFFSSTGRTAPTGGGDARLHIMQNATDANVIDGLCSSPWIRDARASDTQILNNARAFLGR